MIFVENVPLHIQVKKDILNKVEKGEYLPGKRIPSERMLTEIYGVSRVTIRQAIDELLKKGVLMKKPGSGTYVKSISIEQPMARLCGIMEELKQKNIQTSFEVLGCEFISCTEAEHTLWDKLEIPDTDKVYMVKRKLYAEHIPFLLDYNYVSEDIGIKFETLDCGKDIFFQALEHFGYEISYAQQKLSARMPDSSQKSLLELEKDEAVLMVERTIYTPKDRPLMYTVALFAGSRYSYNVTLRRDI